MWGETKNKGGQRIRVWEGKSETASELRKSQKGRHVRGAWAEK